MTKLTLGPIAYHWPPERRRDFYARIADEAAVDEVYLGEVICSKRAPFHEPDLPETIERLRRAGKTVILSTLAEVMLVRERKATAELASLEAPEIEINNAAGLFARGRRPHRIGPFMNAYNEATIAWMASQGATHVCLPVELPGPAVAVAAGAARALGMGVEAQVFGRASLAVSARCYHARPWPDQRQLSPCVRGASRRNAPAHHGRPTDPSRQRHPDPIGILSGVDRRDPRARRRRSHASAPDAAGGRHGGGGEPVPRAS
nr:U32 family peptidase [Oceanicella actignis]